MKVSLCSGAGNTFLVAYPDPVQLKALKEKYGQDLARLVNVFAKQVPLQEWDGALVLEHLRGSNFRWYFYNHDGSMAEMCGNAARCVGLTILTEKQSGPILLETLSQAVKIDRVPGGLFKVDMPAVKIVKEEISVAATRGVFVDTGVPHFVTDAKLSKSQCSDIRNNKAVFPKGTNVTLVDPRGDARISAVTFERGVEDFTKACGTGAVAAAYYYFKKGGQQKCLVDMPGGELKVSFENGLDRPILVGPAVVLKEYELEV